jgi:hypothetical protein
MKVGEEKVGEAKQAHEELMAEKEATTEAMVRRHEEQLQEEEDLRNQIIEIAKTEKEKRKIAEAKVEHAAEELRVAQAEAGEKELALTQHLANTVQQLEQHNNEHSSMTQHLEQRDEEHCAVAMAGADVAEYKVVIKAMEEEHVAMIKATVEEHAAVLKAKDAALKEAEEYAAFLQHYSIEGNAESLLPNATDSAVQEVAFDAGQLGFGVELKVRQVPFVSKPKGQMHTLKKLTGSSLPVPLGLLVNSIIANGQAEKAGVAKGSLLVAVAQKSLASLQISNSNQLAECVQKQRRPMVLSFKPPICDNRQHRSVCVSRRAAGTYVATVNIEVYASVPSGQTMNIMPSQSDRRVFSVVVPPGVAIGQKIVVQVPAAARNPKDVELGKYKKLLVAAEKATEEGKRKNEQLHAELKNEKSKGKVSQSLGVPDVESGRELTMAQVKALMEKHKTLQGSCLKAKDGIMGKAFALMEKYKTLQGQAATLKEAHDNLKAELQSRRQLTAKQTQTEHDAAVKATDEEHAEALKSAVDAQFSDASAALESAVKANEEEYASLLLAQEAEHEAALAEKEEKMNDIMGKVNALMEKHTALQQEATSSSEALKETVEEMGTRGEEHDAATKELEKGHTAALQATEAEHAVLVGDLLDQIGQSETREKAHLETIRIQREESESAAELVSSNSKFITPALILGKPVEIAYGLKELLGVNSQAVGGFLMDAMSAIRSECEAAGLEEDRQNLQHILAGTQKGGWEATKSIDELLAHSSSKLAHLEKNHVVELRMYTSS